MPDNPDGLFIPIALPFGDSSPAAGASHASSGSIQRGVLVDPPPASSGKLAKLGLQRSNDFMYYIKGGDVWRVGRKTPGSEKSDPEKIAEVGIEMDMENYLYYLDGDGDVSRKARR